MVPPSFLSFFSSPLPCAAPKVVFGVEGGHVPLLPLFPACDSHTSLTIPLFLSRCHVPLPPASKWCLAFLLQRYDVLQPGTIDIFFFTFLSLSLFLSRGTRPREPYKTKIVATAFPFFSSFFFSFIEGRRSLEVEKNALTSCVT